MDSQSLPIKKVLPIEDKRPFTVGDKRVVFSASLHKFDDIFDQILE